MIHLNDCYVRLVQLWAQGTKDLVEYVLPLLEQAGRLLP